MVEIFSLLFLLFLGHVINSKRLEWFVFVKTLAVFVGMVLFSTIVFLLLVLILLYISRFTAAPLSKSPFTTIFMMILISGMFLYFVVSKLAKKWHLSMTIFTLIEYYIQWGLIYITLYQVAIDNFIKGSDFEKLIEGGVDNPAYLMLAILPSFISVWVAIIMYKLEKHEIKQ